MKSDTIVALTVKEDEIFAVYVLGPIQNIADPTGHIGSRITFFKIINGYPIPVNNPRVHNIYYTDLHQVKGTTDTKNALRRL